MFGLCSEFATSQPLRVLVHIEAACAPIKYVLRRALVCLRSGRGATDPEACVIKARPASSRDVLLVAMRRPGDRITDHGGGFRLAPDIAKHPKCAPKPGNFLAKRRCAHAAQVDMNTGDNCEQGYAHFLCRSSLSVNY